MISFKAALALGILAAALGGCMAPKSAAQKAKDAGKSDSSSLYQAVDLSDGNLTAYPATGEHQPIYKIAWQKAKASGSGGQDFTAEASTVSGSLFENGQEVSRFTADQASVDRKKGVLTVSGNVKVVSEKKGPLYGSTLSCLKIKYTEARRLIEASGSVMLTSSDSQLGPFSRLDAAPDLSKVGTPDTFGPMNHNP